jgi:PAS domain-containing protein
MPSRSDASTVMTGSPGVSAVKPVEVPSAQDSVNSLSSTSILKQATTHPHQKIAPMPGTISSDETSFVNFGTDDKRQHKRAANRKSAQLSRKRKKQYIEELKDENDELRRKELILRSIPDLIVVFDSSGKLSFVSESFATFLDKPVEDLEGTSFWDRICQNSVRLLKAAFMDALAAREPHADTTALGSGVWELQLLDKNTTYTVVTLNGVVHFTGESPECVCCIRPSGKVSDHNVRKERKVKSSKPPGRLVSCSDGSRSSDETGSDDLEVLCVNPNQSVMGFDNQEYVPPDEVEPARNKHQDISDHEISESSGSEDGLASR